MASAPPHADNWSGRHAGFEVQPTWAPTRQGVKSYNVISANNGDGPQMLRVLLPQIPPPASPTTSLSCSRSRPGWATTFGDGLATLQALDAQDQYNLTIIEPSFAIDPWYADNPNDPHLQYETFMTQELVPWVKQNLATTGNEQNWLIGFSKSGIGGAGSHPEAP